MSGVPDKRAKYHLAGENCDLASCLLDGNELYIWYEKNCVADTVLSNCFRKIDLNNFSGTENVLYESRNLSNFASTLIDCGDYISVSGGGNSVIRKEDLSLVYLETADYLSINGWNAETHNFFFAGHYYRAVNILSAHHEGYDVVDAGSWEVVRRINMDMNHVTIISGGLCFGVRESHNFAIFSLIDSDFVFELNTSTGKGAGRVEHPPIHAAYNGKFIAVLCEDILSIVDPEKRIIIKTIIISELSSLRAAAAGTGIDLLDLRISKVKFYEDDIVLSSGQCIVCIVVSSGVCRWVKLYPANVSTTIACIHEDLVFGSKNSRPHAWDRYTGTEVWSASSALPCLSAQVSKNWTVYYQMGGHINCYSWKEPYVSPRRPA